jgi:hypothetical protein
VHREVLALWERGLSTKVGFYSINDLIVRRWATLKKYLGPFQGVALNKVGENPRQGIGEIL